MRLIDMDLRSRIHIEVKRGADAMLTGRLIVASIQNMQADPSLSALDALTAAISVESADDAEKAARLKQEYRHLLEPLSGAKTSGFVFELEGHEDSSDHVYALQAFLEDIFGEDKVSVFTIESRETSKALDQAIADAMLVYRRNILR